MYRNISLLVLLIATVIQTNAVELPASEVQRKLSSAKIGETIVLPAGVITGALIVPAGVSLRGAGYRATIIDASGESEGITVAPIRRNAPSTLTTISNLAIRNAQSANLAITSVDQVLVQRVLLSGSIIGARLNDALVCRLENIVSARNRYGIVVTGGQRNVVVNCTMTDNASLGLSLSSGSEHIAFNNLITNSATAVLLGEQAKKIILDHNLYYGLYIGKVSGQLSRSTLSDWQYLTDLDKHSVQFPIAFVDAPSDNYRPTNTLDWAQDRCVAGDWGAVTLKGVTAPATDIDNNPRIGAPDLGAWETACTALRQSDGTFTVSRGDGLTSAGLFTSQGRLIGYLFHNLPLSKGTHRFWAPLRDFEGKEISAGKYEIRLAEQRLRWEYLGGIGDNGEEWPAGRTAPVWPHSVAFDAWGTLIVGHGWSEDHTNLRAYYADTGELCWTLPGASDLYGLAIGGDNALYLLVKQNDVQTRLTRLHPSTGKVIPFGTPVRPVFTRGATHPSGAMAKAGEGQRIIDLFGTLAATRTKLYLLSQDGTLYWTDLRDPNFIKADFAPDGLTTIAGDRHTDLLWATTHDAHLLAFTNDGQRVTDTTVQPDVQALAANNGFVGAACGTTGKVNIYDANTPASLTLLRSVGRGDGPYGAIEPDRFYFQHPGSWRQPTLALDDLGGFAITDYNRALRFHEDGKYAWHTFGIFGGSLVSFADPSRVFTDNPPGVSIRTDQKTKRWSEEAYWAPLPNAQEFIGEFRNGAGTYRIYRMKPAEKDGRAGLEIHRVFGNDFYPVSALVYSKEQGWLLRKDTNNDHKLDAADGAEVMRNADGTPFTGDINTYLAHRDLDGSFLCRSDANSWNVRWPLTIDPDDVPVYRSANRQILSVDPKTVINPYTWKPEGLGIMVRSFWLPDGSLVGNINMPNSGANSGLMNSIGNSVVEVDTTGKMRWFVPMPQYDALAGFSAAGGFYMVGMGMKPECFLFNKDGLGLGGFATPARMHWEGFWLDYADAIRLYKGADGEIYALIADNVKGSGRWFHLQQKGLIKESVQRWIVNDDRAAELAALPAQPVQFMGARPAAPTIRIPRITQPLPVDGDLLKWQSIVPQIIITPETAGGSIDGPRDCSAIVRLATHGQDLYLQVLRFDDLVSHHQTVEKAYMQDTVELSLNGFIDGFKFNFSKTIDQGDIVQRQRFWGIPATLLPSDTCPRVVKVLDSAADVPERQLIEDIYGEDLKDCQVIIYEAKLPITPEGAYVGDPKAVFSLEPGKSFWIGIMIDDNDDPGTDQQNYLLWPATYGTFNQKEDGAIAVIE